jgi:hypothetical protein
VPCWSAGAALVLASDVIGGIAPGIGVMLAARAVLGVGVGGSWVFGAGAAITLVSERARAEGALNKLGLHTGQEMLLLRLWLEEGIPQSQLAASIGVEPPTATKCCSAWSMRG